MRKAGDAGDRARRDAALGDLVAQVLLVRIAVGRDEFATIDVWFEVEQLGLYAESPLGEQKIAQHNSRTLELVGEIEHLRHQREAVADIQRRRDDAWEVAKRRAQRLPQVALLGLGGHTGGRAGAHAIDRHHGNLGHGRQAETFGHQRKTAARGRAHGTHTRMGRADCHIDDADLVFHLAHQDARLASVRRHPVQHTGGGAHGVGAVELHAGGRTAHRHRSVAAEHRIAVLGHRQGLGKGLEVRRGVVVSGARDVDVFFDHGFALASELGGQHALQRLKAHAHHAEGGALCECVLGNLVAGDIRQRADRERTELHAFRGLARLDGIAVEDAGAARRQQAQVAIHGVLVQWDQQIDPIAHALHFIDAGANREKRMAAANDGLIRVVGVQMQPAPAEDQCEDVAWRGNTLTGRAANTNGEGLTHIVLSLLKPPDLSVLVPSPPEIHDQP